MSALAVHHSVCGVLVQFSCVIESRVRFPISYLPLTNHRYDPRSQKKALDINDNAYTRRPNHFHSDRITVNEGGNTVFIGKHVVQQIGEAGKNY